MANRIKEQHSVFIHPATITKLVEGDFVTVSRAEYDLVLQTYRDLPKELWQQSRLLGRKKKRHLISEDLRSELQQALELLGMPHSSVFAILRPPSTINSQKLTNLVNGRLKSITDAEAEWLKKVIEEAKLRTP
ncbi:MAG: hypothetical protein AAF633_07645 [Chloroflexota bacterium]